MRNSKHLVSWRTYGLVFAIALSPALMQTGDLTCAKTGDPTLSMLEVEVSGQNHIAAFDPEDLSYDVWLPLPEDTAIVRAYSTDPGSQVMYNYSAGSPPPIDYGSLPLGGGEFTLDGLLPEGASRLLVSVKAPGKATYSYVVNVRVGCSDCDDGLTCTADTCNVAQQVCVHNWAPDGGGQCVFPCTEQGILDAIMVGEGPHTFDCDGPTAMLTQGFFIDKDVILDGQGNLEVSSFGADCTWPIFAVYADVTAELHGFMATGHTGRFCHSTPIVNLGTLTVTDSTVAEGGAGIRNHGTLNVANSTVSGNAVGLETDIDATVTAVTNSTVSGNGNLGIHHRGGSLTLANSTVSGGIDEALFVEAQASATVRNSVVVGACSGRMTSLGYNIESPGNTCGFDQATDQVDVSDGDLNLGPLQDNGGPSETHALLPGSVAIDHIPEADCTVTTDQRGVTRPHGTACDVGAFELEQ